MTAVEIMMAGFVLPEEYSICFTIITFMVYTYDLNFESYLKDTEATKAESNELSHGTFYRLLRILTNLPLRSDSTDSTWHYKCIWNVSAWPFLAPPFHIIETYFEVELLRLKFALVALSSAWTTVATGPRRKVYRKEDKKSIDDTQYKLEPRQAYFKTISRTAEYCWHFIIWYWYDNYQIIHYDVCREAHVQHQLNLIAIAIRRLRCFIFGLFTLHRHRKTSYFQKRVLDADYEHCLVLNQSWPW